MIDALVLAGSPNDGMLKECSDADFEALIAIGKRAMVEYVVEALLHSENINRILVVGPGELAELFSPAGIEVISPQTSLMNNIAFGVKHLPQSEQILVITSDIPLITAEAIDDFLRLCRLNKADLYFPVIPQQAVNNKFPSVKRTYVKLKEGTFTGGNVFLVNPGVVSKCIEVGQRLVEARKSPIRLCKIIGLGFLGKYLLHQLSLAEAEQKVSELLGINGRAVICKHPEVGVDVDKPSDLEIVSQTLGISNC